MSNCGLVKNLKSTRDNLSVKEVTVQFGQTGLYVEKCINTVMMKFQSSYLCPSNEADILQTNKNKTTYLDISIRRMFVRATNDVEKRTKTFKTSRQLYTGFPLFYWQKIQDFSRTFQDPHEKFSRTFSEPANV